jgi:GT2 family glycosyltransferase
MHCHLSIASWPETSAMGLSLLIVVLHYRGLDDTLECLASLGRQTYVNLHTVVVDNGSGDKLAARLAEDYPWAEVLELKENRGWSGGNNAGIGLAMERNYDAVCLLNNDTVVPERALERLVATMALLGPCLLHPAIDSYGLDNEVQLDPTIPKPSSMTVTPVAGRADLFEIEVANGSCLLADVSVFRHIGLIDARFFLL